MKIIDLHKCFLITYPVTVDIGCKCKMPYDELRQRLNNEIHSSEYWIVSIDEMEYPDGPQLKLTYKFAYVLEMNATQERLNTFTRLAEELENVLLNNLEKMRGELC